MGRYVLLRPLGVGGMGEVWEAVLHGPLGFRKPVALKVLRAGPADPARRAALLREARLGALLHHPNVVGTLGLGESGGVCYVALELVRGRSVDQLLRACGGRLPGPAVLEIGLQAATGLQHVHTVVVAGRSAGLVHRDLKPSNLLVGEDGRLRIADLGISALPGDEGGVAGTRPYMAPEQAEGRPEQRSDLFSLGATLYQLSTGSLPFGRGGLRAGDTGLARRLEDRAPLAAVDRAVPGLGAVIGRCLRLDPVDRIGTAAELVEVLTGLGRHGPASPTLAQLVGTPTPGQRDLPAVSVAPHAGNLEAAPDRFVGREQELDELEHALRGARLVVLRGPGGAGKSRLAVELARQLCPSLAGGAWLVDLTEARDEAGVVGRVGAALGIAVERRDPVGQLGRVLARRGEVLVVLDHLERCVEALPRTLGRWLEAAPQALFVGTSRVATELLGERTLVVGELDPNEAVALFHERVPRPLRSDEVDDVATLCAALGNLPLAIELGAARTRMMGVAAARSRLGVKLLADDARERLPRHRSLEASLWWSVELLSPAGRSALAQLSVFEAAWELEAADAVVDVRALGGPDWAVDLLQELVDASLVRVEPSGARFSMSTVVREFAGRMEPEGRAAAEERHAAWFARLGSFELLADLAGPGSEALHQALARDLDDLVAACRRTADRGQVERAAALLRAAAVTLVRRGPANHYLLLAGAVARIASPGSAEQAIAEAEWGEASILVGAPDDAVVHFELALAACRRTGARRDEGLVLGKLAGACHDLGRAEEAFALYDSALVAHREVGDRRSVAVSLGNLALLCKTHGRPEEAFRHLVAALAICRDVGHRRAEASVLGNLGSLHREQGRLDLAQQSFDAALAIHREVRNRRSEGVALGNLANLQAQQGRTTIAERTYEEALAIHREVGDRSAEALTLGNLGLMLQQQGDLASSLAHLGDALALHREVVNPSDEAFVLGNLGLAHAELGHLDEAARHYEAAIGLHRQTGNRRSHGIVLGHLGFLRGLQGRADEAVACAEEGLALVREVGDPRFEALGLATLALLQLDRQELDRARASIGSALERVRGVDDRAATGVVHASLGELQRRSGDPGGRGSLLRAVDLLREAGHRGSLGLALCSLALLEAAGRGPAGADAPFTEAAGIARALGAGPESALVRRLVEVGAAIGRPWAG